MRIRGQTHRERVLRKRTLNALGSIRAEMRAGLPKRHAIISALEKNQRAAFGIRGKPFLVEPERKAMKRLDRAVLPGRGTVIKRRAIKAARKIFVRRKYKEKYFLIRDLFRQGPQLGIIMVKPELYSEWRVVMGFLRTIGCNPIFSKNFVFTREDIQRLYPHALADREAYSNFAVLAAAMQTAPSKVIVFEHLPVKSYKELLVKPTTEERPQNLFNGIFKSVIRSEITRNKLLELGFPKDQNEKISGLAKQFDVTGFFEASIPKGFDPMVVLRGVHIPDYGEIPRDARTLLHLSELQAIERKLGIAPSKEVLGYRKAQKRK